MSRCFVAAPLPEDVKDFLIASQPPATPGLRLVGRDKMHLTLHFLGEIEAKKIDAIKESLALVKSAPLTIDLRGVGQFPPRGRANVLWAGIANSPALVALHKAIGAALFAAIRFRPEKRRYSPHLTLARLDRRVGQDMVKNFLQEQRDFQVPSVLLDRFVLYSSLLTNAGSQYHEEGVFPLVSALEFRL
jgi:RNA 2',3'-cyclic 3'-phosphodiesterase